MNKKQKLVVILTAVLILIVGVNWGNKGPTRCNHYYHGHCSGYVYDLDVLIGEFLTIGIPAALLYYIFGKGE